MSTENDGTEGMPLTRRELRARERLLAERLEQEKAARASAPFDQELEELPRRRNIIERLPALEQEPESAAPAAPPAEEPRPVAPPPAEEKTQAMPAVEPRTEAPAASSEPITARIAPVPARSHAQHFYPDPGPTRLNPLVHGHKAAGSGQPRQEARTAPLAEPAEAPAAAEEHHGQHQATPDHSFHFVHSPEPVHETVEPLRTAFQEESASPRKHRRIRGWVAVLLSLALVAGGGFLAVQFVGPILGWNRVSDYPGPGEGSVAVEVHEGSSVNQVANTLKDDGVVADAGTFSKAFSASGVTLSPGKYTFRKGMRSADAVAVFGANGKDKVSYVALSAGLRIGESLDAIAKGTGLKVDDLKALSDKPSQFGVSSKAKNLEGYLFPGEYRFALGGTAKDILSQLVKATQDELSSQGITDPDKQYDAVTIASIVQAEGGRADYPTVAGAIMNRLQHNAQTLGFIQSDATVTYGLGRKSYNLTSAEKSDKGNPYNTYANPGLPAGPIGSPGKVAIDAAAHPKASNYLYWVTINLDTGETLFASTLEEHNKNVARYQDWCKANAGRCQ